MLLLCSLGRWLSAVFRLASTSKETSDTKSRALAVKKRSSATRGYSKIVEAEMWRTLLCEIQARRFKMQSVVKNYTLENHKSK